MIKHTKRYYLAKDKFLLNKKQLDGYIFYKPIEDKYYQVHQVVPSIPIRDLLESIDLKVIK